MATHTHTTSRRRLLATAPTALAMSGVAAAAPLTVNPDAGLLVFCARCKALYYEIDAAYVGSTLANEDDIYEAMSGRRGEQASIFEAIIAAPPTTPAGFAAVVNILVLRDPRIIKSSPGQDDGERLTGALLRGILARAAA